MMLINAAGLVFIGAVPEASSMSMKLPSGRCRKAESIGEDTWAAAKRGL
jgi:hypothetical protein